MRKNMKLSVLRRTFVALIAVLLSMTALAQGGGITGRVIDETGEPIIGASVIEKANQSNGVITNVDGQFTIKVAQGATLVVSYIGYTQQEVSARNGMTVTMKEDENTLQDVVVIGYGVQKKSVVTAWRERPPCAWTTP